MLGDLDPMVDVPEPGRSKQGGSSLEPSCLSLSKHPGRGNYPWRLSGGWGGERGSPGCLQHAYFWERVDKTSDWLQGGLGGAQLKILTYGTYGKRSFSLGTMTAPGSNTTHLILAEGQATREQKAEGWYCFMNCYFSYIYV